MISKSPFLVTNSRASLDNRAEKLQKEASGQACPDLTTKPFDLSSLPWRKHPSQGFSEAAKGGTTGRFL